MIQWLGQRGSRYLCTPVIDILVSLVTLATNVAVVTFIFCGGVSDLCLFSVVVYQIFVYFLWWCIRSLFIFCGGVSDLCLFSVVVYQIFVYFLWWCIRSLFIFCGGVSDLCLFVRRKVRVCFLHTKCWRGDEETVSNIDRAFWNCNESERLAVRMAAGRTPNDTALGM
jgi:hypothetical protein